MTEGHAPAITDHPPAGFEDCPPLPKAAKGVAVAYSIETGVAKRQACSICKGNPATPGNTICQGSLRSDPESRQRKVHKGDIAASLLGQVQRRPAGAGP
jgi:hypothetical protein